MPGPLYVPVLPVRAHAASAFGKLDAQTADRTAPLWTLPVIGGGAGQPAESVQKALRSAVRVQQHRAGWLDAPYTSLDDDPYAELLRYYWSDTPLLPVADPARPRSHQALAAECAAETGGGLGVRIRVPGAFRDELAAHTEALLAYVGAGVPMDLLLDLQAVLPARPMRPRKRCAHSTNWFLWPHGARSPFSRADSPMRPAGCWTGSGGLPSGRTGTPGASCAPVGGPTRGPYATATTAPLPRAT